MLYTFDSIQDFGKACGKLNPHKPNTTRWYGFESYENALNGCTKNDVSLVAQSDEFLAKVEAESIETLQPY